MRTREVLIEWIDRCLAREVGEEIFLPCNNKGEGKVLFNRFKKELDILANIDFKAATGVKISHGYRDGRQWVILKRVAHIPTIGFAKGVDGKKERIEI